MLLQMLLFRHELQQFFNILAMAKRLQWQIGVDVTDTVEIFCDIKSQLFLKITGDRRQFASECEFMALHRLKSEILEPL